MAGNYFMIYICCQCVLGLLILLIHYILICMGIFNEMFIKGSKVLAVQVLAVQVGRIILR